jgi:hypothetical protein
MKNKQTETMPGARKGFSPCAGVLFFSIDTESRKALFFHPLQEAICG